MQIKTPACQRWTGLFGSVFQSSSVQHVPDQAADDTIESLHSKIMSDLTVGGYAIDVQPVRTEFEFIEADEPLGVISNEFEIRYRTQVADLTQ